MLPVPSKRTGSVYWYWLWHGVHLGLLGCIVCILGLTSSNWKGSKLLAYPLVSPLSERYVVARNVSLHAYFNRGLAVCGLLSLSVLVLKFEYSTLSCSIGAFRWWPLDGLYERLRQREEHCDESGRCRLDIYDRLIKENDAPLGLTLASSLLLLAVGITRGFGVWVIVANVYGIVTSLNVGTLAALLLDSLQLPLSVALQTVPYRKCSRMLLFGFVIGSGAAILHTVSNLHPNNRVLQKLNTLTRQTSAETLALRRVALMRALESADVALFCRADQGLCQLQKEILGLSSNPVDEELYPRPSEGFRSWVKEIWYAKYAVSRSYAQIDLLFSDNKSGSAASEPIEASKHEEEEEEDEEEEGEEPIGIKYVNSSRFQEHYKTLSSIDRYISAVPTPHSSFVIENEHLLRLKSRSVPSSPESDDVSKNDSLGLSRTLLIECTVEAQRTVTALPFTEDRMNESPTTDVIVWCNGNNKGKELSFLEALISGGTSPIWYMPSEMGGRRPIYSGVLSLKDLEALFSSNELKQTYEDYEYVGRAPS